MKHHLRIKIKHSIPCMCFVHMLKIKLTALTPPSKRFLCSSPRLFNLRLSHGLYIAMDWNPQCHALGTMNDCIMRKFLLQMSSKFIANDACASRDQQNSRQRPLLIDYYNISFLELKVQLLLTFCVTRVSEPLYRSRVIVTFLRT